MQIAAQSLSLSASSLHYRSEQETLSLSSPSAAVSKGVEAVCESSGDDPLEGVDPKYRMMALMLEALTGQKITLAAFRPNATAGSAVGSAGTGSVPSNSPILEYQYQMQELNRMSFSAEGKAVLEDGTVREFSLSIEWTQSFSESVRLRIQDGKILTDPLVISFDGSQPLSSNAFAFNLTGKEGQSLPYLSGRAGYLALDNDRDGKITQGSELFGPRTGEGFMELAAHDDDGNGWIDSGDAVFKQLRVWMVNEEGENLLSLQEAGIGAISLKTASIDYAFKSDADTTVAQYKKASVALGETAGAYGVFEVDVAV
ncbi:MAG: hypothetical protein ACOZBX_03095 [Campylobacterota bacterium]